MHSNDLHTKLRLAIAEQNDTQVQELLDRGSDPLYSSRPYDQENSLVLSCTLARWDYLTSLLAHCYLESSTEIRLMCFWASLAHKNPKGVSLLFADGMSASDILYDPHIVVNLNPECMSSLWTTLSKKPKQLTSQIHHASASNAKFEVLLAIVDSITRDELWCTNFRHTLRLGVDYKSPRMHEIARDLSDWSIDGTHFSPTEQENLLMCARDLLHAGYEPNGSVLSAWNRAFAPLMTALREKTLFEAIVQPTTQKKASGRI